MYQTSVLGYWPFQGGETYFVIIIYAIANVVLVHSVIFGILSSSLELDLFCNYILLTSIMYYNRMSGCNLDISAYHLFRLNINMQL